MIKKIKINSNAVIGYSLVWVTTGQCQGRFCLHCIIEIPTEFPIHLTNKVKDKISWTNAISDDWYILVLLPVVCICHSGSFPIIYPQKCTSIADDKQL